MEIPGGLTISWPVSNRGACYATGGEVMKGKYIEDLTGGPTPVKTIVGPNSIGPLGYLRIDPNGPELAARKASGDKIVAIDSNGKIQFSCKTIEILEHWIKYKDANGNVCRMFAGWIYDVDGNLTGDYAEALQISALCDPIPEGSKTAEFVIDRNRDDSNSIIEDRQTIKISFTTMQKLEPVYNEMYGCYDNRYSFDGKEYILYGDTKPIVTYNYAEGCKPPEVPDMAAVFGMTSTASKLQNIDGDIFQNVSGVLTPAMTATSASKSTPTTSSGNLTELEAKVARYLLDDNYIFPPNNTLTTAAKERYKKDFTVYKNKVAKELVARVPKYYLEYGFNKTKIHIIIPNTPFNSYFPNQTEYSGFYSPSSGEIYLKPNWINKMNNKQFFKENYVVHEYGHFIMDQYLKAKPLYPDYSVWKPSVGKELFLRFQKLYAACDDHEPSHSFISPYASTDVFEYFADSFAAFCDSQDKVTLSSLDNAMYKELLNIFTGVKNPNVEK